MSSRNKRAAIEPRPNQQTPTDLVDELMTFIRRQFCTEIEPGEWFKRNRQFILARVVLWPASFMRKKGFTLPPARYKQIMYEILHGVQRFGDTGQIGYWPAYLAKCVQSHWEKRWTHYYDESKTTAPAVTTVMDRLGHLQKLPETHKIDQLAAAQNILSRRLAERPVSDAKKQLSLGF